MTSYPRTPSHPWLPRHSRARPALNHSPPLPIQLKDSCLHQIHLFKRPVWSCVCSCSSSRSATLLTGCSLRDVSRSKLSPKPNGNISPLRQIAVDRSWRWLAEASPTPTVTILRSGVSDRIVLCVVVSTYCN